MIQNIMMFVKLKCGHTAGFESGLTTWELDVGEWERASQSALADAVKYTLPMNMAPNFRRDNLQLGAYENSAALRTALLHRCYSSRNFRASQTTLAGNGTGADDDNRMQVDSLKKGKEKCKGEHPAQKGICTSNVDVNIRENCGRTGQW